MGNGGNNKKYYKWIIPEWQSLLVAIIGAKLHSRRILARMKSVALPQREIQRECGPCPAVSRMRSHPHKKSPMRLLTPETPVGSVDYRTENFCSWLRNHQPSERNQIAFFLFLDLYWSSPKTGDLWYKSKRLKWTSCSPSGGLWGGAITCFLIAENHRALDIVHLALSPLRLNLCRDEGIGLRVQG